ncbi:MAG: protein kinase [Myxococcales bacterium]|nr:protein kinase [Myxococcales bacterium]
MGDAVRGGDVHSSDGDTTVDGEQPRAVAEPKPIPPPAATIYDYGGLITVDRHHYLVSREIAKGGMGRVLEARDLRLGRQVAIKELLPRSRDVAKRFEREALITARLQHPSIIHVYEAGIWPGGEPFYAMPHIAGRSLDKVVAERKTLAARLDLLSNVISVADALAYAHSENVIHRDLKPANVLVGEYGETVVIDWGLAKDLDTTGDAKESQQMSVRALIDETPGSVVGTPAYMPPEQARGEAVDERSDVYAIGALLYKVLVGRAPYEAGKAKTVIELVKARAPVPIQDREAGVPRDLVAIVEKAMARDPNDRYPTAGALARDLKRFQTGQLVDAHRYTRAQLVWRFVKHHRVALMIAATALAVLAIVGVVSVRSILVERETAKRAQNKAEAGRIALLEERGRSELLAGHTGAALAYLVSAAKDGLRGGARGFLIADAMRPFHAERAALRGGTAVAVSPDGLQILTAGHGNVLLSNVDGAPLRSFPEARTIRVVAFDPKGTRFLAAGDDGVARIWSLAGAELSRLTGHAGTINDAAFNSDGTRVVTGGEDSTVRVWNVATGAQIAISACHSQAVTSVRFSPDGARVASASHDHTACVSSAITGGFITQIRGHKGSVNSVRWTRDGAFLLTASDDGTACVWSAGGSNPTPDNPDAGGGKLVVAPIHHDRSTSIDVAELSPDGTRVLTAGDDHVARVWELPDLVAEQGTPPAQLVWTLGGHADKLVAAAFSSDGLRIATAGFDNRATVWDATTGEPIGTFEHSDIVGGVTFAVGHARLVTGSRDGTVRIWNVSDGVAKVGDEQLESAIHVLAVSSDGTVAAGTDDSRVTLWHGSAANVLQGHMGRVLALAFARPLADGSSLLVTGGDDQQPIVWSVREGKAKALRKLGKPSPPDAPAQKTTSITFAPDGDTVATLIKRNAGRIVQLWSATTGEAKRVLTADVQIDTIAYSSTGLLAGAGIHGALVLWDPARDSPIASWPQRGPVTSLAFSDDGGSLVVAGQGELRIYRVVSALGATILLFERRIDGPTGEVRAVVFEDHAKLAITASDDGVARVWDATKGKLLATRDPHGKPLTSLALTPTGDKVWIASEDGTLGQWDVSVDTSSYGALETFMQLHVPWKLDDDVIQHAEGAPDGEH